ncbi:MAG: Uma2 family endonuclease [Microcystis wesenbergii TW10]|jgi:Uma2 family endonuclease|uniref:Uma2 family endonuclease n=1 Tax=Microcystis wesenbergii TW10 TaxID=2060474 RepID=A0A3E0LXF9_9CHRO|nr:MULTISPECIES: Uma2 family endonuclease [unclassified Microcystis]MCZ8037529.1 Uma2 family endonuclease [Microcystis sp. LE17-20A]MCZ8212197.1 Uma2 family endonuclease [Microcystis sp. LE19-8.1F]REJ52088.1 MAG: Uma2 family endonuclease [Microcystis wesenbergii TW10]
MQQLETRGITDSWIKGTWEEYLAAINNFPENQGKSYYYNGYYRLEMTPIGNDHASDHAILIFAVSLYATLKNLSFNAKDNCSFRRSGYREVQPDISYYFADEANLIPYGTSIIDLNQYPPPDLVIEISKSTLNDDLGNKRLLYEELGVSEYWSVKVDDPQIFAFEIIDRGSKRIDISKVLPNLKLSVLESALQQARTRDQSQVGRWLISQFQG